LPKLEKTVFELERKLRLANSTLMNIPRAMPDNTNKLKNSRGNQMNDEESHGLIEEEKENLVAEMDFEVSFLFKFCKKN